MTEEEEAANRVWMDGRMVPQQDTSLEPQARYMIQSQRQYYDEVHVIKEQVRLIAAVVCKARRLDLTCSLHKLLKIIVRSVLLCQRQDCTHAASNRQTKSRCHAHETSALSGINTGVNLWAGLHGAGPHA